MSVPDFTSPSYIYTHDFIPFDYCEGCGTFVYDTIYSTRMHYCWACNFLHARIGVQLNRAKKASLPATLTITEFRHAINYFNGKCAYCLTQPWKVIEHVIPMNCGGGTTAGNCVPACRKCNHTKSCYIREIPENVAAYLASVTPQEARQ